MGLIPAGDSEIFFENFHHVHVIYFIALGGEKDLPSLKIAEMDRSVFK